MSNLRRAVDHGDASTSASEVSSSKEESASVFPALEAPRRRQIVDTADAAPEIVRGLRGRVIPRLVLRRAVLIDELGDSSGCRFCVLF